MGGSDRRRKPISRGFAQIRWRMPWPEPSKSKLHALGITLKRAGRRRSPITCRIVRTGNLLTVSGQLCLGGDGKLAAKGQLGGGVSIEDGQKAARVCAINLPVTQVKAALGDLDKVTRVVRLGGFINSAPGFTDGPKVMNGASDLMVEVFGDKGKHARSTVGVSALPADAAVEVEGTVRSLLKTVCDLARLADRPGPSRIAGCMTPRRGIIENTAGAVRAAIAAIYGVEVDVQISADGEAMVHHDDVLGRLTEGEGRLDRLSAAELKRVPFRGSSERMMTLGELCDLVGGRVTMLIELKSRFDGDTRLPERVAAVLAGYRGAGRADVVRSAADGLVCGKRAAADARASLRQNTGRIHIGT